MGFARSVAAWCLVASTWGCASSEEDLGPDELSDDTGGETGSDTETGDGDSEGEGGDESGGDLPVPEDDSVVVEDVACTLDSVGTPVFGQRVSGGGVSGSSPREIESVALDEEFVYFRDDFGVYRVERDGGAPQRLVELDGQTAYHLVLHGAEMSWVQSDNGALWELWTATKTGESPRMVTSYQGTIPSLRSQGGDLVWNGSEFRDVKTHLLYVLPAGTTTPRIVAEDPLRGFGPAYGWRFDVDGGYVYAVGALPGGDTPDEDALFRVPVSGGEVELLAGELEDGFARVVDADAENVYVLGETTLDEASSEGGSLSAVPLGDAPAPLSVSSAQGLLVGVSAEGDAWLLGEPPSQLASVGADYMFAHDGTEMFVVRSSLECLEWESDYDEHTGSTFEYCTRSITHRCVDMVALP